MTIPSLPHWYPPPSKRMLWCFTCPLDFSNTLSKPYLLIFASESYPQISLEVVL